MRVPSRDNAVRRHARSPSVSSVPRRRDGDAPEMPLLVVLVERVDVVAQPSRSRSSAVGGSAARK